MTDPREQLEPLIRFLGVNKVAEMSGVPQPSISLWLAGQRPMSPERVQQIITSMIEHHRAQIAALRSIKPKKIG